MAALARNAGDRRRRRGPVDHAGMHGTPPPGLPSASGQQRGIASRDVDVIATMASGSGSSSSWTSSCTAAAGVARRRRIRRAAIGAVQADLVRAAVESAGAGRVGHVAVGHVHVGAVRVVAMRSCQQRADGARASRTGSKVPLLWLPAAKASSAALPRARVCHALASGAGGSRFSRADAWERRPGPSPSERSLLDSAPGPTNPRHCAG
jgi:hypothetical protein